MTVRLPSPARPLRRLHPLLLGMVAAAAVACSSSSSTSETPKDDGPEPKPSDVAATTGAQRLTIAQYTASIHDIFGDDVVVPTSLEPDVSQEGMVAIGSSYSTISKRGVEQYEAAAFKVAQQALKTEAGQKRVIPCTPQGADDAACLEQTIKTLGRKVWRRPLSADEATRLLTVSQSAATGLGSFQKGAEFAIAALLQSPNFLYRGGYGEGATGRYGAHALATRLSYFLWNSTPDDALLDAADSGALLTDEGLEKEARRLVDSPRARVGLRNFVSQYLQLQTLSDLSKDAKIFTYFSPEVGPSAREETLRVFESLAFDEQGDFRDIFTTRRTFVNPKLASMYGVFAPKADGFAQIEFPPDSPRAGILGHISILAVYAHPTSSSPTLRGKFIRQSLLCEPIPPPPVNVNTALPEPSGTTLTLRDRVKEHLTDPGCAACHRLMDPVGLGLENFDGIGRYRKLDNGVTIDASGALDAVPFGDAAGLGRALHDDPRASACFVRTMYRYATSFTESSKENGTIDNLFWKFRHDGYRIKGLMLSVALSPGFRLAGDPR